mgnify:CR=1 FL=1
MRRTRLVRVDEDFYKKIKEYSEKRNKTITEITRNLAKVLEKLEAILFED